MVNDLADRIEKIASLANKALPVAKLDEVSASAVDWDGKALSDSEPAKWETEAGTIRAMVEEISVMRGLVPAILSTLRRPVPADVADLVERFSEPFDGMLSEIIQCHQLRKSAAIMDAQTKRETGWAETSDRAEHMRKAADTIEALTLLTTLASGRDEWLPQLGTEVRMADHVPDSEAWNQDRWFVVGMVSELGVQGINVYVGPEYPLESEGATDGFWINRWPKPDDIIWPATPPQGDQQ